MASRPSAAALLHSLKWHVLRNHFLPEYLEYYTDGTARFWVSACNHVHDGSHAVELCCALIRALRVLQPDGSHASSGQCRAATFRVTVRQT